jgi:two-component system, sensor histidine kinase and response regulator
MVDKSASNGEAPSQEYAVLDKLATRLATAIGKPAQSILALADDVLDTALSAMQREQIRHIRTAAEGLLDVVNDLGDYARLEGRKINLLKTPFSLRDHIAQVGGSRVRPARDKGLLLRVEIDGDVPDSLIGDPGRLGHVLGHLMDTCLAVTDHGEVVLHVEPEFITQNEATLRFTALDSSAGLPDDIKASLDGNPNTTLSGGATGVGLTVACGLIKAMGGQLQYSYSRRSGGGNTLTFSVSFGIFKGRDDKPIPQHYSSLVALPVLVVSDEGQEREELAKLFQSWHMFPLEADSGEMAIALLERGINAGRPIPLVAFTNRIHGQDGFLFAMQIKRHAEANSARLIMLTNDGRRGDAIKCRENGIAGYLPKPINPHDLREAVNTIMGVMRDENFAPTLVTRHSLREKRQGASILLVEDDRDSQLLAAHFLDRKSFSVVLATNDAEALKMAEQQRFDIVLLDMELPGLDGLAVARKIRAAEKIAGAHVPIIAMMSDTGVQKEKLYRESGITDFLVKPLKRDVLLATVSQYITEEE